MRHSSGTMNFYVPDSRCMKVYERMWLLLTSRHETSTRVIPRELSSRRLTVSCPASLLSSRPPVLCLTSPGRAAKNDGQPQFDGYLCSDLENCTKEPFSVNILR